MIRYELAHTDSDLQSILDLQRANLPHSISKEEAAKEGFVTVEHDLELLKQMNAPYPHVIAKHEDSIIGYVLVMLPSFGSSISILIPMFEQINNTSYKGQLLKHSRYFVMGQTCIHKDYRGQGIFQGLYQHLIRQMKGHFDYILTEVDSNNQRSLRAHAKVGFEVVDKYTAGRVIWVLLLLELK